MNSERLHGTIPEQEKKAYRHGMMPSSLEGSIGGGKSNSLPLSAAHPPLVVSAAGGQPIREVDQECRGARLFLALVSEKEIITLPLAEKQH